MTGAAEVRERAAALHREATIVNALGGGSAIMPASRESEFRLAEIMREGGVTAANLTLAVSEGFGETCTKLSRLLQAIDRSGGELRLARTVDDIHTAKRDGAAAAIVGFQNSDPIEGNLEYLDLFHRLGLRVVQLTYQRRNLAADGCGEAANAGLSVFGRELVAELNRLGILIDLSHTCVTSTLEAIELSEAPVAITHACLQAFNPVPRNKTDEEVKALAARGGVFGMNAVARLLSPRGRQEGATLDDFLDQIDYLVELVGVEHVGLGLDISEGLTPELFEQRRRTFLAQYPELTMGGDFPFEHYYLFGLTSMAHLGIVTEGLVARGYADDDVLAILGGNFLRLFEQTWRPAEPA